MESKLYFAIVVFFCAIALTRCACPQDDASAEYYDSETIHTDFELVLTSFEPGEEHSGFQLPVSSSVVEVDAMRFVAILKCAHFEPNPAAGHLNRFTQVLCRCPDGKRRWFVVDITEDEAYVYLEHANCRALLHSIRQAEALITKPTYRR